MSLFKKIKIKLNTLKEFYVFQQMAWPGIKQDKISKSLIKKYLPVNPVIIDCGAHDGVDSVELYRIMGGTVHAFEPVTSIYERLRERTRSYAQIKCYRLALSNQNSIQFFYVSEGASDASSSLLEPKEHLTDHPDTQFNNKVEVQTVTLDDWALQNNINAIDMLWLDMQGFELMMLKQSEKILKTVKVIHTEISTRETYKGVGLYKEYRAFLEEKGFRVILEAIPEGWDMGNVLFVRK